MIYTANITTPTTATADAPTKTELAVTPGVIHRVKVFFPPGCQQVAHCRILQGLHQIYPTDIGGFSMSVDFNDYLEIKKGYTTLMVETWNTGNNQHKIDVGIYVMKEWQLTSYPAISKLNTTLKKLITTIIEIAREIMKQKEDKNNAGYEYREVEEGEETGS